ncbi:DNA-binding protein P3A2-like isoform X1 [Rhopilema esculentum]|uniref:DNA-binding protein P3A2-like isoform X1 n=2 Tax=Rhopilema esculentum TaxID=499914 RepID=UPI0031E0AD53
MAKVSEKTVMADRWESCRLIWAPEMMMDQNSDVKLENLTQVSVHGSHLGQVEPMSDDVSDDPSSPESTTFDDSDLLSGVHRSLMICLKSKLHAELDKPRTIFLDNGYSDVISSYTGERKDRKFFGCQKGGVPDDVTTHLANAGPIGVAAAAAIVTGKKRKRPHSFELTPSVRKRQATRLLRKLKQVIDEFTTRVGQQACVVVCCPGKVNSSFKVFGAAPLENVVRNCKQLIMNDLDNALQQQAPQPQPDTSGLHELPPLVVDGIPTPVDKMTQAQLRAFIPVMLKYSTGRGKPGWGKESTRPPWWPEDVPWANVRSDARTEEAKASVSWTNALRKIVRNCYKYHGREDLLIEFKENGEAQSVSHETQYTQVQYPHMVHTINNADGTVSIIQVDASGTVTTLSEATTHSEATQAVATLAEVAAASQGEMILQTQQATSISIDPAALQGGEGVTTLTEASLQDGQLLLGDAASAAAAALVGVHEGSGVVSIPVQAAAAMMQIQGGNIIPISTATALQLISSNAAQISLASHTALAASSSPVTNTTSSIHLDSLPISEHSVEKSHNEIVPVAVHAVEVDSLGEDPESQVSSFLCCLKDPLSPSSADVHNMLPIVGQVVQLKPFRRKLLPISFKTTHFVLERYNWQNSFASHLFCI